MKIIVLVEDGDDADLAQQIAEDIPHETFSAGGSQWRSGTPLQRRAEAISEVDQTERLCDRVSLPRLPRKRSGRVGTVEAVEGGESG